MLARPAVLLITVLFIVVLLVFWAVVGGAVVGTVVVVGNGGHVVGDGKIGPPAGQFDVPLPFGRDRADPPKKPAESADKDIREPAVEGGIRLAVTPPAASEIPIETL